MGAALSMGDVGAWGIDCDACRPGAQASIAEVEASSSSVSSPPKRYSDFSLEKLSRAGVKQGMTRRPLMRGSEFGDRGGSDHGASPQSALHRQEQLAQLQESARILRARLQKLDDVDVLPSADSGVCESGDARRSVLEQLQYLNHQIKSLASSHMGENVPPAESGHRTKCHVDDDLCVPAVSASQQPVDACSGGKKGKGSILCGQTVSPRIQESALSILKPLSPPSARRQGKCNLIE